MKRLPKRFFYVLLEYGEGAKLRYSAKAGGKYTDEAHAIAQWKRLTSQGVRCSVHATAPVIWGEITPGKDVE